MTYWDLSEEEAPLLADAIERWLAFQYSQEETTDEIEISPLP